MSQQSRLQLQMMLSQQSGPGALPLGNLGPDDFLEFLRKIEQVVLDERLSPVMVCWSSHDAQRLLPTGQRYRELLRDAFCYSVFSENRQDVPDEWLFLLECQGLCLVVYGQQMAGSNQFQCAGSFDPMIAGGAFALMQPFFQFVDLAESNRLEQSRANLGQGNSAPLLVQRCRAEWPLLKGQVQAQGQSQVQIPQPQPQQPQQAYAPQPTAGEPPAGLMPPPPPPGPSTSGYSWGVDPLKEAGQTRMMAAPAETGGTPLASVWGEVEPEPHPADPVAPPPMPMPVPEQPVQPQASPAQAYQWGGQEAQQAPPERTPISEAVAAAVGRSIFTQSAQEIMRDIVDRLRHSSDLSAILQLAIERLTQVGKAHRGLIWQVVGNQLAVTNEFSISEHNCFVGQPLPAEESTAMVFEFLSRFPDESGAGVISIPDTFQDTKLHKLSPTLASLIELGDVRARLVAQLRCRGKFSGFVELQECGRTRNWSEEDSNVIQSVCNMLAVVVQQSRDQSNIQSDAQKMELLNEIANLFRESRGQRSQDTLVKSAQLVAEHIGFLHAQIYLFDPTEGLLVPQMDGGQTAAVDPAQKDNPFVQVYESGRDKIINLEFSRKGDPYFGHETAILMPLVSESECFGVLGFWERQPNRPQLTEKDRDVATPIAAQLAVHVRADQAIAQIRADQSRSALINRVSSEIRQSLKEADQILETLVQSFQEYFGLALCVVSQFDLNAQDFTKSKSVGVLHDASNPEATNVGEQLILSMLEELKQDKIVFLTAPEIAQRLMGKNVAMPPTIKGATLAPLIHAGNLKAALCMVSTDRVKPWPERDIKMVDDLADRVAVVISHAELFAQVERQAITDPMTGLYNRRHFGEQFSKELDRYKRFGHPFSYIIVDLDFLKKINDNLGHQFGDAAIKQIANVLKKTTRDVDTAARYGGEEFTILLPVTDVPNARIAAERICSAIRESPVEGIGTITASVGVSTFPHDTDDRDKLTELADQALYLAKHRGRNQVCSVSEDLLPSLSEKGEEALQVQQHTVAKKAEDLPIDLNVIAEHGILGLMGTVIKFIEAKDAYSKDRSPKAAEFATKLASALRLSKEHITIISLAAVLNNLGKVALPKEILQKKGPLTDEERKVIEQSPAIAAKILEPAKHLHRVASVVESYHEHWDGTGYPKGLKGEEIPLESRIIALVDAYIAMTSDRPYRPALSHADAVKEIQKGAGKEWDPRLVKLFLPVLQKEQAAGKT